MDVEEHKIWSFKFSVGIVPLKFDIEAPTLEDAKKQLIKILQSAIAAVSTM